jgi:hypothetical protein
LPSGKVVAEVKKNATAGWLSKTRQMLGDIHKCGHLRADGGLANA